MTCPSHEPATARGAPKTPPRPSGTRARQRQPGPRVGPTPDRPHTTRGTNPPPPTTPPPRPNQTQKDKSLVDRRRCPRRRRDRGRRSTGTRCSPATTPGPRVLTTPRVPPTPAGATQHPCACRCLNARERGTARVPALGSSAPAAPAHRPASAGSSPPPGHRGIPGSEKPEWSTLPRNIL